MIIEIDRYGRQRVITPSTQKISRRELTEDQKAKIEKLAEQSAERITKRLKAKEHERKNKQREETRRVIEGQEKLFKIQGHHIRSASMEEAEEIAKELLSGSGSFKRSLMNDDCQLCYGSGTIPELVTS
ncbi:hypothetical protein [Draconibacterium sediminis]|uniref:Uncharacterized protein n=1 Tax=Draconibacterium sediminis TaxID=1544798 RepID=A0A0D8JBA3_9BACT|nr:hypothetical protein [Draconibacterium sediminis]KJF43093.1 hypothetical protein LH29_17085 [Draconibacterium sediminis]